MNKLILFHGTPDKIVVPTYGKGEENQGKLFDFVAQNFPNMDTEDFINV